MNFDIIKGKLTQCSYLITNYFSFKQHSAHPCSVYNALLYKVILYCIVSSSALSFVFFRAGALQD